MIEIQTLHEQAMDFSFHAKQQRGIGDEDSAINLFEKAAALESKVADFYIDKPELEPTRSIMIRSAAFLNLKAGLIDKAEKYIFTGLSNPLDISIKEQLYSALELCMAYKGMESQAISINVDYIYKLRQKSILYSIEPKLPVYGHAATLEMISDFSTNYTKSLKAFSKIKYKRQFLTEGVIYDMIEDAADRFQDNMNPIVTSAGFGSFKFAIAADWLPRFGEDQQSTRLKSNMVLRYHEEIFSKQLTKENIQDFKDEYNDEEINDIFRPLLNISSRKNEFKVSYYDRNSLKRHYVNTTGDKLKRQLLPIKTLTGEDIGRLENTISHKRSDNKGHLHKSILLKQELKSGTFDYPINVLAPNGFDPFILTQQIVINVGFNSEIGFVLSIEDLPIESTNKTFNQALNDFYLNLIDHINYLNQKEERTLEEERQWSYITSIVSNPGRITLR
jgi:hypothetical protein